VRLKQQLLNLNRHMEGNCQWYADWLVVPDGTTAFEALANGDGSPGGSLSLLTLFQFIHHKNIRNVVWLTADVHYAAAHYYDPNKAQLTDFKPFWICSGTLKLRDVWTERLTTPLARR